MWAVDETDGQEEEDVCVLYDRTLCGRQVIRK